MFKFIFRTLALFGILIIIIVALIFWKGGDGFRWIGKQTESAGKAIGKFGDMVDGVKEKKWQRGKDETINKRKEPE